MLKKRFDDVFESTRYTKALEALNKTKKEIVSKAKDLKAELMEQGAHLQATVLTKNELENYQENQENTTSELDRLKTELEGNQDRVSFFFNLFYLTFMSNALNVFLFVTIAQAVHRGAGGCAQLQHADRQFGAAGAGDRASRAGEAARLGPRSRRNRRGDPA